MASNTDLVRNATPNFATTLNGSILNTDTTMTLASTSGLPTGTGVTLTIDATNASGVLTPSVEETITGVVSGSTVTNMLRGKDGTTAQGHASGANVTMWITANLWNDFQTSYLAGHSQLGYHKALYDVNDHLWIDQTATTSAVNNLLVSNAATGNAPAITAEGSDTNVSLNLVPKGTGVVQVNGTQMGPQAFYYPYKFSVYRNASLTLPGGGGTVVFDTKNFDTGSNYSVSTGYFTASIAGFYWFNASVDFSISGDQGIGIQISFVVNGSANYAGSQYVNMYTGNYGTTASSSKFLKLNANDTVQIQTSTGSIPINTGVGNTYFEGFLVSVT